MRRFLSWERAAKAARYSYYIFIMSKRNFKRNASLCQTCFNFDCSWHNDFKPRDDWRAIARTYNDAGHVVESYEVIKCPGYRARNGKYPVKLSTVAQILGVSIRTVHRYIESGYINTFFILKYGLQLVGELEEGKKYKTYYLTRIGKCL